MFAEIWTMEHFRYYLYGREFILKTDHKALEVFNTKGCVESQRIQRWMDSIPTFNFRVEYQKGQTIEHMDALSRQFMNEIGNDKSDIDTRIIEVHEGLIHRGAKAVHHELIRTGYTDISEEDVRKTISKCKTCKLYNPIKTRAHRVVKTFEPGERIGFDIIELSKGNNILVAIDYFTRRGFAKHSNSRQHIKH